MTTKKKSDIVRFVENLDDVLHTLTGHRLPDLGGRLLDLLNPVQGLQDDPYAVLEVRPTASDFVVKAAYRARAKTTHPDAAGGSAEEFKKVQAAYDKIAQLREWKK